jgi:signal recognition particle receptor subunit alpha
MLDHFSIFTRGGITLWTWGGGTPLRGSPLDALVRGCLVEDRPPGGAGFAYAPPGGGAPYCVKWALDNVSLCFYSF